MSRINSTLDKQQTVTLKSQLLDVLRIHQTTYWAVSVFRALCSVKRSLKKLSNEELTEVMLQFVMEACHQYKNPYPPSMLIHSKAATIAAVPGTAASATVIQQTVTITEFHPDSPA